jgi:ATP-dependent helicase HrpB
VLTAADRLHDAPPAVRAAARDVEETARSAGLARPGAGTDEALLRALLAGFPDRVARRREPLSSRLVLSTGQGAVLGRESGVRGGELLLALDVSGGAAGAAGEPMVRSASRVEREWLAPVAREIVHRFDEVTGAVRAFACDRYEGLLLGERPVPVDPERAAELLAAALEQRGLGPAARALQNRLRAAGLEADLHAAVVAACQGRTSLPPLERPDQWLDPSLRVRLDRLAPERLPLPSGRTAELEYRDDGSIVASVKLQEIFGLADTPRLGPRRTPVLFELLAPNGRAVQTTRDLRGFWERTYPEVRKELRGRYPRHPWPEDPWTAEPTHRAKKRG